jgi:predicted Rossmann fold nucleotide-binding protein DprA/Smf involved in DNA uptake
MAFNVATIESTSPAFPAALQTGTLIPPVAQLWAIGNLDILKMPLLGLFCSTRCPGNVILRTYDLALALREAEAPIISGFHTPMEKECLDVFLRGAQPIVLCPARDIQRLRLPAAWRKPLAEGRLLIVSAIAAAQRRTTAALAEQRNRVVAILAQTICVSHAAPGSRTERLCAELVAQGKRIYTLGLAENAHLVQCGVVSCSISELIQQTHYPANTTQSRTVLKNWRKR